MLEAPRRAPPTGMSPPPLALHSRLDLHGLRVLSSSDRAPVSFFLYPSISRLGLAWRLSSLEPVGHVQTCTTGVRLGASSFFQVEGSSRTPPFLD